MQQAVDGFLKAVLRSGLLTREQLQVALRSRPEGVSDDPEALADHLVKTGKLSRFQAGKLLKGTARGLVLGPFQVLAPVGKGGMGTVYLARDARNGQLLALKILPPRRARTEERLLARFRREMEISRRVAHEHIAWTYDVGVAEGVYYIAMEFIPGKSMHRLVADEGPLSVRRAARLFAEIAAALEHAHAQGVIHRDLKPSNVMVTPNDHAKLLDLGLALVQGEVGAEREVVGGSGYVVGTMDWIAPEQTEDAASVDARSDLYGLGCTLYFALSGRPPFRGGSSREKIHRHRNEEPARLEVISPLVPRAFADLAHRLMAKSPAGRFQNAAEVRKALAPWAAGEKALPLDRQGDSAFLRAVTAVQLCEVPPELIEVIGPGAGFPAAGGSGREYLWLGMGLLGFWAVLFAVLGLVLLLR